MFGVDVGVGAWCCVVFPRNDQMEWIDDVPVSRKGIKFHGTTAPTSLVRLMLRLSQELQSSRVLGPK